MLFLIKTKIFGKENESLLPHHAIVHEPEWDLDPISFFARINVGHDGIFYC